MALSSRETQAAEPALPDYLSWKAPGAPAAVRIHLDVVDAMSAEVIEGFNALPRRGVEVGGILLGRREGETIIIDRFERIPCEYRFGPSYILSDQDKRRFEDARAGLARAGERSIAGYYRSHTRRDLQLEPSDLEVIQRWFDDPSAVFLIVKPLDITHLEAEFFFFENGKLRMESAGREFAFKGRGLAASSSEKPLAFAPPPPEPANSVPGNGADVAPAPRDFRRAAVAPPAFSQPTTRSFFVRYWEAITATFLVLCAAGLFVWQHWGGSDSDSAEQPAASPVASTASPSAASPTAPTSPAPASLGLDVRPDPGVWHVNWSRDLPAIRTALRGMLSIEDGGSHKQLPLDPDQLRSGSVPYRHMGDDVTFRLEVFGPDNQASSETFRVLLAPKPKKAAAPALPPQKAPETAVSAPPKPASGHVIPAEVVNRVQPDIPEGIRSRITEEIVVLVKINIDVKGRVTHAAPVTRGDGLTSYLALRASEAAMKWRFEPARENERPVPSAQVIRFVFEK